MQTGEVFAAACESAPSSSRRNCEPRDVALAVRSLAERVTVTATKTGAADVQSTPVAITVLPAMALDQMGVHTVEGLAGVVPTVTISQHTGLAQVTIRGIGTNRTFGDPSSTVHLDGVYLGRPAMVFADFLNVERVEVLRGPQGTLYGRNSVGGTINIVTRQPSNTLETSARLTAGNYDKLRAEGAVSGPLIKNKVMGNFAFLRGTREGFVKDLDHPDHTLGSEDTWAGRGQLRVVLGTHSELLLSGDRGQYEGVPLTYAKALVAKPGLPAFRQPHQPVEGADERLDLWEEHPAGCFGEAGCPVEPNDDADQPDGVSEIQLSVLHRRRCHRTASCRHPTCLTSSARSRRR